MSRRFRMRRARRKMVKSRLRSRSPMRKADALVAEAASKSFDILDSLEHLERDIKKDVSLARSTFRTVYDCIQGWDGLDSKAKNKALRKMKVSAKRLSDTISEDGRKHLGRGVDNLLRIIEDIVVRG